MEPSFSRTKLARNLKSKNTDPQRLFVMCVELEPTQPQSLPLHITFEHVILDIYCVSVNNSPCASYIIPHLVLVCARVYSRFLTPQHAWASECTDIMCPEQQLCNPGASRCAVIMPSAR